jgi:hypothetical protein
MKIINKLPNSSDMIDKEVDKLFNSKLSVFLGYAFPLFCCIGWLLILFAIFSS